MENGHNNSAGCITLRAYVLFRWIITSLFQHILFCLNLYSANMCIQQAILPPFTIRNKHNDKSNISFYNPTIDHNLTLNTRSTLSDVPVPNIVYSIYKKTAYHEYATTTETRH